MPKQPSVTDFTKIEPKPPEPKPPFAVTTQYHVFVKLDSRWVIVATCRGKDDAEQTELAINQAMIEYRTKRNAWEKQLCPK